MTTTEQNIEVRLRPEQWSLLANMLARAAAVSDPHKSVAEQTREKSQAAKMREAVQACRNSGCAMSASAERWAAFLRTGERLAKYSGEWRALADITGILSKGMSDGERESEA